MTAAVATASNEENNIIVATTFYEEEEPKRPRNKTKHLNKSSQSTKSVKITDATNLIQSTKQIKNNPSEPDTSSAKTTRSTRSTASQEPSTKDVEPIVSTRSTRSSAKDVEPAVSTRSTRSSSAKDVEPTVSTRSTRRTSAASELPPTSTRSTRSSTKPSESTVSTRSTRSSSDKDISTVEPTVSSTRTTRSSDKATESTKAESIKATEPSSSAKAVPAEKVTEPTVSENSTSKSKKKSSSKVYRWTDPSGVRIKMPAGVKTHPVLDKLRTLELDLTFHLKDLPAEVPKAKVEEEEIKVVKKDNIFSADVTEAEMEIIKQRVARQQQQFAEYEHREKIRKFKKVYSIFDYLTIEEMEEMLKDCNNDEDELVVRMTEPTYLLEIRKTIASRHAPAVVKRVERRNTSTSKMTPGQLEAYEKLVNKRSSTLRKTTDDSAKKQYRLGGRLALDDAIRQVQEQGVDAKTAFEGWSAARIRAYNLIDQNPNSYYYRFNAPGEVQRKGQWAADERKLFFDRLEDVGANGQWGHFAMTIPGRVGYQCSNFYRLLVENGEVNDPNYVLDEKGKAHYLFDKKNANGTVEKTFRTHNKHGRSPETKAAASSSKASSSTTTTTTKSRKRATASTGKASTKRKRRTRRWGSDDDDDDDDDEDDDDMFADWQDNSGSYTSSSARAASNRGTSTRRTRARMTSTNDMDEDPSLSTAGKGKQPATEQDQLAEEEYYDGEENELEVLPGFIDPITLDQVVKPAISKYGHVMGYDSWVRCLTNWEGKKNICPLTKKQLSKRDLVILTFENIEEYRDQIMNM